MKKIGFCINALEIGGAERLLIDIIRALYETKRYEIYLFTKHESDSSFYKEIKNIVNHSYLISKEREIKNKKYGRIGTLISSLHKKKSFEKFEKKVDVVIDFLDGDFYKYVKKIKKKKKIIWLHSAYKELQVRKKIDKKIDGYDKIITITEEMLSYMKKELNIKDICMVYNMIDFEKIDILLKEKLSLEEEDLLSKEYFLTVCRLNEKEKDVKTLLKAYSEYKGDELLYIIGDGPDKKELEEIAISLKIGERVKFLGRKSNPFPYMKNCKLFILSTNYEGFGLVVVEALYCGAKVISSDCDYGPREILLNGEVGELFSIGDHKELLKKIKISLKKEYPKDVIESSLKRFKKDEIIKKIESIIN